MATRAQVVTSWVRDVAGNHPLLADAYALTSWEDVTGQPTTNILPAPNAYTVECVAEDAVIVAIAADARFAVLWSEPEVVNAGP